jgi:hypothetical protein
MRRGVGEMESIVGVGANAVRAATCYRLLMPRPCSVQDSFERHWTRGQFCTGMYSVCVPARPPKLKVNGTASPGATFGTTKLHW